MTVAKMMTIEFVDLKRQYREIKSEIDSAIDAVIRDTAFIGGKHVAEFESAFANYVGVRHCIGVGNGTDALFIALKMLNIGAGDEVITVANSFVATSEAISATGAMVRFVDCDPETYNLDVTQLERLISAKTKAIVPVHLYGNPVDFEPLMALAKKYNLRIVEDCAQAHGARYRSQSIGSIGDCACFSFFPGKNLGAFGDAGAVVTNDDELAKKIRRFKDHGRTGKYSHEVEGINSRLDGLQAAILNAKLPFLEQWTERRITISKRYAEAFKGLMVTPTVDEQNRHVFHLYVVQLDNRDQVREALSQYGISSGIHYPTPLPFLEAYRSFNYTPEQFPVSHRLKDRILSLPIHGSMTDEEVAYVIESLSAILK